MQAEAIKHEIAVMDTSGDTKLIWESDNEVEVEAAEEMFNKLTKKGYKAFSVGKGGKQDELISEFDSDLEKIILVPPVVGG